MNQKLLVAVHGYSGDAHQIRELMPMYEHHNAPIVILSPEDHPITEMGPHICRQAGKRAYIGQLSWDRQWAQLALLRRDYPDFEWYLLNDSDSFVLTPEIDPELMKDEMTMYSNEVDDFRVPGVDGIPLDYHKGHPHVAMQPPYLVSGKALDDIISCSWPLKACPITPFIDWWWIPACDLAVVSHKPFPNGAGASCETVTPLGLAVMSDRVRTGATFIHSVKSGSVARQLHDIYQEKLAS